MKYVCSICGYEYAPTDYDGVLFENQDDDFYCPVCGVKKDEFFAQE